jgi:long-chain-alcohol oxidase
MQALYSEEHARLTDGYGARYETAPAHPSLAAAFGAWRGARPWLEQTSKLARAAGVGILLRDRGGGEVRVAKDGAPLPRYALCGFDLAHVRRSFDAVARILEEAGAREIHSAHARGLSYAPGSGARERFLEDADRAGWGAGRCVFYSFHIMGTARLGDSPEGSACDENGETWEMRNLVVADGSAFPTASGVNPMISIMATAHVVASRLANRLAH